MPSLVLRLSHLHSYISDKDVTKTNEDDTSDILSDLDLALRVKHENGQFIEDIALLVPHLQF